MKTTEAMNRAFYDRLYRPRSALARLFRAAASFDQRSKAAPNLSMILPLLDSAAADAPARSAGFRLLDYGCGWGTLLLSLHRRPVQLYGTDLSPDAVPGVVSAAKLLGSSVSEAPRDASGRLAADYFDVIVCSHVLEHVPDDAALLEEFKSALRTQGHLLLNVPINEVVIDPKHARAYTDASVQQRVRDAGFIIICTRAVDRWTAFLLKAGDNAGPVVRIAVRLLRGALALLPWRVADAVGERLLAGAFPRQQFLLLCRADE